MGDTTEEWKDQERQIINEFFKVKVPQTLGSKQNNQPKATRILSTDFGSKSTAECGCSETSCIDFAKIITKSDDIVLADNQGSNSFTLLCPSKSQVIQFRLKPFNTTVVDLAHQIYRNKVPRAVLHEGFPLPVYSSDIIPGRVHVLQPFPEDKFPLEREKATVIDLGWFVARATFFPRPKSPYSSTSWATTAKEKLEHLQANASLQALAPEVAKVVVRLQSGLHCLNELPAVLTHHDFAQVNIFVNDAGKVTGVIDFDEAGIEPFGMCIWGLYEGFFGSMERGKWSFYNQAADGYPGRTVREVLESAFWDSLWSNVSPDFRRQDCEAAVEIALGVGIINRYFVRGMIDDIDESQKIHRLSLEYVKGILPAVGSRRAFNQSLEAHVGQR